MSYTLKLLLLQLSLYVLEYTNLSLEIKSMSAHALMINNIL